MAPLVERRTPAPAGSPPDWFPGRMLRWAAIVALPTVLSPACAGRPSPETDAVEDAARSPHVPARDPVSPPREPASAEGPAPNGSTVPPAETTSELPRRDTAPANLPEGFVAFDRACDRGARQITIAAIGDLLIHRELQRQAFASPEHFRALWTGVEGLLRNADVTYANLEGPTAAGIDRWGKERKDPGLVFDNKVYSGYARFNYHPQLLEDLVDTGIDIVSTANNHSLDRGPIGVDRTIAALRRAGLSFTGTRRQDEPHAPWHAVTQVQGLNLAWLACTLHTNYQTDHQGQVLRCFDDPTAVPKLVQQLAQRKDIDAVIVTPHWGKEYEHRPMGKQRRLAQAVLDAGAVAVIGSHPHVLQPWEVLATPDGRQGLVMFSLGNFASHQRELPKRASVVLYVGLTQGEDGTVWVNGARYAPITVRMEGNKARFFVEPARPAPDGPAGVYAHITRLMGAPNRLQPGQAVRTNPQCDAHWPAVNP